MVVVEAAERMKKGRFHRESGEGLSTAGYVVKDGQVVRRGPRPLVFTGDVARPKYFRLCECGNWILIPERPGRGPLQVRCEHADEPWHGEYQKEYEVEA